MLVSDYSGWLLDDHKVDDLRSLCEIIQVPYKFIERCEEKELYGLIELIFNSWLPFSPKYKVYNGKVVRADYTEIDMNNIAKSIASTPGLTLVEEFGGWIVMTDEDKPYSAGVRVTYLNPSLKVDSVIRCPKTGATWLWPLSRTFRTKDRSELEILITAQEYATEAYREALSKLSYFDIRYDEQVNSSSFLRALCDSLRLNNKQYGALLDTVGAGLTTQHNLIHTILLCLKNSIFDIKTQREVSIAVSKYLTEGLFK